MTKSLSFLSLAAALAVASGCVVNDNDDGGDDTTGSNDPTNGTTNDPTNDPSNGTTNDPTNTTNEDDSSTGQPPADTGSSGTAGPADSSGSGSGDETAGPTGACGWGETGQKRVPMGYICDGDGEDPEGMYMLDCPEKTELVEGGECGMIRGQGCCDTNGDVWFCAADGAEPQLFTESCQP
jgi:hypothetical protein